MEFHPEPRSGLKRTGFERSDTDFCAFTLIELLVGLAVLTILVTLLTTVFSNFSEVASSSTSRMETSEQTRTLFDRMAFDVNSAVMAGGVRIGIEKNSALPGGTAANDDVLILLTRAKTDDSDGRLAKIGYGIGPYEDQSRSITLQTLLRYVEAFGWDEDTTDIAITAASYAQPMAPGVIRFELAFVNKEGDILAAPPTSGPQAIRDFHENLSAIICTIATLEEDALQKLTVADRNTISTRLGNAVDGQAPIALWETVSMSDLPKPVIRGLRFHQRYFPLK